MGLNNKIYNNHAKLPEDIRNTPWRFDCKGSVLCQDVQICDCQGSMEMARFIATAHNEILVNEIVADLTSSPK